MFKSQLFSYSSLLLDIGGRNYFGAWRVEMMVKRVQSRQKTLGLLNESPLHILVCAELFLKVVQPRKNFPLSSSSNCAGTAQLCQTGSKREKSWDR